MKKSRAGWLHNIPKHGRMFAVTCFLFFILMPIYWNWHVQKIIFPRRTNFNIYISSANQTHQRDVKIVIGPMVHLPKNIATTPRKSAIVPTVHPPRNIAQPPLSSRYSICILFRGRLGNQMFEFASSYGIAAARNMSVWMSQDNLLKDVFDINGVSFKEKTFLERNCVVIGEGRHMRAFKTQLLNFPYRHNYVFRQFLQSWKYFYNATSIIRQQFTFKTQILHLKDKVIKSILTKYNYASRSNVTFIGVHVRRGDYLQVYSDRIASKRYLQRAVDHFVSKHLPNTIFIVCSNDMDWTVENMPREINVEFVTGTTAGEDLAILGSCDHMITSVGTYSWWAGWLTGGEVTYYQWPAVEGAPERKPFPAEWRDYFYPGWIGLSGV